MQRFAKGCTKKVTKQAIPILFQKVLCSFNLSLNRLLRYSASLLKSLIVIARSKTKCNGGGLHTITVIRDMLSEVPASH